MLECKFAHFVTSLLRLAPLEARSSAVSVFTVNSGGPCESTTVHHRAGLRCYDSPREFADAILNLVNDLELAIQFG